MSYITLNSKKLIHNYHYLSEIFDENKIEWAIVAKLLCGNRKFLQCLLELTDKNICDSRLSNLKQIKEISPKTRTIYIKPPAKRLAAEIVRYADTSFNTELDTLTVLSKEAVKQGKIHQVVIMVDMGELREGILGKNLSQFYRKAGKLLGIKVVGIGTNFKCLNGTLPDEEKMLKLNRMKETLEKDHNVKIPFISAGSSVTIPMVLNNHLPAAINHFRIGETLFFGTDVYHDSKFKGMYHDVFKLTAEIIELTEKPMTPVGKIGKNLVGEKPVFSETEKDRRSFRAIVDIGVLDVDPKHLKPMLKGIDIIGASSDMMILDLHGNEGNFGVGDTIDFSMNYMSVLRTMNSDYIDKKIDTEIKPSELKILEFNN